MKQIALSLSPVCRSSVLTFRSTTKRFILFVLALLVQLALAPLMQADTATWDAGGASPTAPVAGSGNWTATDVNWSDGVADHTWTNGDLRHLRGQWCGWNGDRWQQFYRLRHYLQYQLHPQSGVHADAHKQRHHYRRHRYEQCDRFIFRRQCRMDSGRRRCVNRNIGGNDQYTGTAIIDNGLVTVGGNDTRQYFTGDVIVNSNGALRYTSGGAAGGQGILGGSKVLIVNGGVVYGTSTSKYLQAHKVVVDNGGSFQTLNAGAVGIGIYTNMDARSGFIGMSSMRYVQCTLAKSTPGTLIITNKPYSAGFGYSNTTINAGILLLDKSNEKRPTNSSGRSLLPAGRWSTAMARRSTPGRRLVLLLQRSSRGLPRSRLLMPARVPVPLPSRRSLEMWVAQWISWRLAPGPR